MNFVSLWPMVQNTHGYYLHAFSRIVFSYHQSSFPNPAYGCWLYLLCLMWVLCQACAGHNQVTHVPANIHGLISIKAWTAVGPFSFDTGRQQPRSTITNNDLIATGLHEDSVTGDNIGRLQKVFPWQTISAHDGFIDLFEYVKDPKSNKSNFYLFSTINSEIDQQVVLAFDYAAGAMLWLNGDKIFVGCHKTGTPRKLDRFITTHLKRGTNNLFLKINREENLVAWKFVFYITSLQEAKVLYQANYQADFVNNPNILNATLSLYPGPYTMSDISAVYIAPSGSDSFTKHPLSQPFLSSNLSADMPDLAQGFYRCRILAGRDTMEETIYKGSLFEWENNMKRDTGTIKVDTTIRNEMNLNIAKFQGRLWNNEDTTSAPTQRERQKKCVFYADAANAVISHLRAGNKDFMGLSGTYIKTYYARLQQRSNAFLFHVNSQLINSRKKIPLVMIIPWTLPAEEFIYEGYFDGMSQFEADIALADKYGFAIAWTFLRKSNYVFTMADDIKGTLSRLREDYNIDTSNDFLLGDSEGAKRALMLASNDRGKYKGLALFVPDWSEKSKANIAGLEKTAVLIARAREDKFPRDISLSFVEAIKRSGGYPVYMEYDGGHESFRKDHRRIGFHFFSTLINGQHPESGEASSLHPPFH